MPDLLIPDVPAEDLARLDARAERLGLSRTDLLRRRLHAEARRLAEATVSRHDLTVVSELAQDLADDDVMRGAWPPAS